MSNDEFNSSQRQNEFVVLLTLGLKPWVNIFPIAEFPMVATLRLTCGNVGGNYLYRYFSIRQRGSLTVQNHLYGFTLWYFSRACFLLFAFGFQQKSVAILFGTPKRLKSFSGLKSCNVAGTDIQLSDKVKILGATLDSNLTMEPHTKALSSSCFYHVWSFKQIRSSACWIACCVMRLLCQYY